MMRAAVIRPSGLSLPARRCAYPSIVLVRVFDRQPCSAETQQIPLVSDGKLKRSKKAIQLYGV
jgi:hypothetical protein